jgi:integrase
MASVEERGPFQFRAKVRRNGQAISKTFETRAEATAWARVNEGKVTGDEYVDRSAVQGTSLAEACTWFLEHIAPMGKDGKRRPETNYIVNQITHAGFWKDSEFGVWSIVSVKPWDLIEWVAEAIEDRSAQTLVHRLNTLSQIYKKFSLAHKTEISNPVTDGVRPGLERGRNRRLNARLDEDGKDEEERLLAAAKKCTRAWLAPALTIAIETAIRRGELAALAWSDVWLDARHPHIDLPTSKNGNQRRIPLSDAAQMAFRDLEAQAKGKEQFHPGRRVIGAETGWALGAAWRSAIKPEEFPDLRWHDLRHEAISRFFELTDLRDAEIMAISGHLRPEMLARYTHLRADRLGPRLPKKLARQAAPQSE